MIIIIIISNNNNYNNNHDSTHDCACAILQATSTCMHTASLSTNTDACMADLKSVAKQVRPKDTFACLYRVHVRHTMNLTCAPYCTDYEMYMHQYKYGTHIHMYKDMSLKARC